MHKEGLTNTTAPLLHAPVSCHYKQWVGFFKLGLLLGIGWNVNFKGPCFHYDVIATGFPYTCQFLTLNLVSLLFFHKVRELEAAGPMLCVAEAAVPGLVLRFSLLYITILLLCLQPSTHSLCCVPNFLCSNIALAQKSLEKEM